MVARAERRAKERKVPKLPPGANVALRTLKAAIKDHGSEGSRSPEHVPAGAKVVALDMWKEAAISIGHRVWLATNREVDTAFRRAFGKLQTEDRIAAWSDDLACGSPTPRDRTRQNHESTLPKGQNG